jgi:hypothetical protein
VYMLLGVRVCVSRGPSAVYTSLTIIEIQISLLG